ncbi:MAG: DUF116 domain-containing protein [Candidatus Eisenbacteria bacterium]|nr:DUF116 domain-containing protein [Candidatus Eisenbacteria bacterium]
MQTQLGPLWREGERNERSLDTAGQGRKLFLFLSSFSLVLIVALLWLLFFLLEPRFSALGERALFGLSLSIKLGGVAAVILTVSEFSSASTGLRLLPRSLGQLWVVCFLLPLSERLGTICGISSDKVIASFLEFNNALVKAETSDKVRSRVLLLLPQCLQNSACSIMLSGDIRNCAECGSCSVCELKLLLPKYGFETRIVGGGSLARKMVDEFRPDGVVGVACERELVAALREIRKVPVIAVSNWRPEGPCRNTKVIVDKVDAALWILLKRSSSQCSMQ